MKFARVFRLPENLHKGSSLAVINAQLTLRETQNMENIIIRRPWSRRLFFLEQGLGEHGEFYKGKKPWKSMSFSLKIIT